MKELKALNKYFVRYKLRLILGVIFVTASNLFAVFPAQSVRLAIDLVKENLQVYAQFNQSSLSAKLAAQVGTVVLFFGILIIAFALIRGVFMYLMRQTIIVMSRLIEYDMKNEIYAHYQKLSLSFYRKNSTGDLMARISEDVSRVRMYVGPAVMYAINLFVTIALVLWAMFSVNMRLSLLVITPLPILSYIIFRVNNTINKRSDAIQQKLSELTTFVQEAFSGIRVIKAFASEKRMYESFNDLTEDYRQKQLHLAKVDAVFFPAMFLLTGLSTLITIFAGGFEVINGNASLGNIAEFVIYVNMLTWPVASLGYTSSLIQRAAASQARINQFLNTTPEITSASHTPFVFKQKITFNNITFTYPGKTIPALNNVNINIEKGKILGVLGSTGSGKSTIGALLLRLFDPSSGEVTIDEVNLKNVNLTEYKDCIGYVPQDVFLFSDTISNNIAFGSTRTITQNNIQQAAQMAAVHENIIQFKDGYETLLGERGITLSGGQKQRVAIARAIVKNPDILILDDSLSAVDTQTETYIIENLSKVMKDKTGVIISNRVSSVKAADHIIILSDGEIVEEGSHADLLAQNKIYADMYRKQLKDEDNVVD